MGRPATARLVATVRDIEGFGFGLLWQPAEVGIEKGEYVGADCPAINLEPSIDSFA
jgi:hypothetical protein